MHFDARTFLFAHFSAESPPRKMKTSKKREGCFLTADLHQPYEGFAHKAQTSYSMVGACGEPGRDMVQVCAFLMPIGLVQVSPKRE